MAPYIFCFQNPGLCQRHVDPVLRPEMWYNQARPQSATVIRDILQYHHIINMSWPSLSPDLNPSGHLWDEIQKRFKQLLPAPATQADIQQAIYRV